MVRRTRRDRFSATEWRPGPEYRVVCNCQKHSHARKTVVRMVSRGMAVLLSIPLAFAMVDLPNTEAMTANLTALRKLELRPEKPLTPVAEPHETKPDARALPIFTTRAVRSQFFVPERAQGGGQFTLDLFREDYFRAHIPYGDIIHREARRNQLPPELVAAMVHTESDFRAGLVSHKSAQGLMQIVPSTAALLGVDDPFDPAKNIAAGTRYFRYLLDRFDDETMALAAYNAGEGNVARFGGIPPFAETRDYISKVNRRTRRYREGFRNTYIAEARLRRSAAH
jgi:soluble lytic murein transglycosylase-like protein